MPSGKKKWLVNSEIECLLYVFTALNQSRMRAHVQVPNKRKPKSGLSKYDN